MKIIDVEVGDFIRAINTENNVFIFGKFDKEDNDYNLLTIHDPQEINKF